MLYSVLELYLLAKDLKMKPGNHLKIPILAYGESLSRNTSY